MRFILSSLMSLTVFALPPAVIYEKCEKSVIQITVWGKEPNKTWAGTGVCIYPNIIVTNRHITANWFQISIKKDKEEFKISDIFEDPRHEVDLAYIILEKSNLRPIPIANKLPCVGEPVYLIGNPGGLLYSFSCGTYNGLRRVEDYAFLFHTAISAPGSSGGALLNSYGELIGITFGKYEPFSVAIPYYYFKPIIVELEKKSKQELSK